MTPRDNHVEIIRDRFNTIRVSFELAHDSGTSIYKTISASVNVPLIARSDLKSVYYYVYTIRESITANNLPKSLAV